MPLLIGYSPSFASAKKHSGTSSSGGEGNNTGQTGSNNGGSTGSANQQQCPNGEHFDSKKNKCVKDTSNQQGQVGAISTQNMTNDGSTLVATKAKTPGPCVGETHWDASLNVNGSGSSHCIPNSIPLPDGSCVAGYHLVIGSKPPLCAKDTATTTTATQDTRRILGSLICVTGKCLTQNGFISNLGPATTTGATTGATTALPNADGTCPSGYHKVAKDPSHFLCAIDTPSTQQSQLPGTPTCNGDTHLDNGKCVGNDVRLPDGSCVPGYHSGLVPGGETLTCIKNPPCPEAGTQYDPQSGKCLFNRVPDNIPTTPSKQSNTGTGGGGGGTTTGTTTGNCVGETHYDSKSGQCIDNIHPLPDGKCIAGRHLQDPTQPPSPNNDCIKDTPTTQTTPVKCVGETHLDAKTGQCVSNSIPLPDGTCATGWQFISEFACGQTHIEAHSTTQGGTTTGGNKSSTTTPSAQIQNNNTSTNTNTVINQNTVRGQAGVGGTASPSSINSGPAYTQTPSMSMWSLSLGKSNFPKEGLRLLANLKPFGTIGVPYTLDISFNLPSANVSLIAAQITNAGPQHAVIIPINKTAEGAAGESLFQAELGQTITGINPFTRQPDAISGGGPTDLLLFNNGNSDIVFSDDSGATMTLRYR